MRALIVFESIFGNTRDVADAIARGMNDAGLIAPLALREGRERARAGALETIDGLREVVAVEVQLRRGCRSRRRHRRRFAGVSREPFALVEAEPAAAVELELDVYRRVHPRAETERSLVELLRASEVGDGKDREYMARGGRHPALVPRSGASAEVCR